MIDIKSLNMDELCALMAGVNEPPFRAKQVFSWIHRGVTSFGEMRNIPKTLQEKLDAVCEIKVATVRAKQESRNDGTIKYVWQMPDGNCVESVFMEYKHGNTVCVSTQVGCRQGCVFCASTKGGMIRNLEPSEMLEQVMRAQADTGKRVSNVVLMGTGEPLDNFDNVIKFIKLLNDEHGLNIGMRHISLSTCGLCDKIDELAHLKLQITLSVSLHAADDVTRSGIMPINNKYNINTLIETCKRYFMETSRRISFEYTMISGVSDTEEQARKLSAVLAGMPCHVNLIPLNRIANSELKPSEPAQIDAFTQILENAGVTVTTRRSLGSDIDAACGQLVRSVASDIEARGDLK